MPLSEYEALIDYLEELEDALELREAISEATEFTPFDEMVATMRAERAPVYRVATERQVEKQLRYLACQMCRTWLASRVLVQRASISPWRHGEH
jgi:crotonobetainyl-CoA:carnitine CoA-transferase CaiB-like acyl-CoA transferase